MQIKEYLNKICEQIKYKPVREEISKEIEDHINDIKEDLIKDGANETTAEIKAINQMGNAEEIGRKLNKIHKPKLDWKLLIITFVLICFGFVVSFIKTTSDIAETNNLNFMTRFILFTLFGIVLGIGVYFSNYKKVQKLHRKNNKHHLEYKDKHNIDYEAMAIDWECSRFTKKSSPRTAYEQLCKVLGEMKSIYDNPKTTTIEKMKIRSTGFDLEKNMIKALMNTHLKYNKHHKFVFSA